MKILRAVHHTEVRYMRHASRGSFASTPLIALVTAMVVAGCFGPPSDGGAPWIGVTGQAISGGYVDRVSTAVVGVVGTQGGFSMCSGTLIGPNLVLSARHCVAPVLDEVNGGVACDRTTFGRTRPASGFLITTQSQFTMRQADYHQVVEVIVPPSDDSFCGNDQALLILESQVPAGEASPLLPRVDEEVVSGEVYSAIGYGGTSDSGSGAGTRRRRDNLAVSCVTIECDSPGVFPTEVVGEEGVCQGDSGGPALDEQHRVFGVASRGGAGCVRPVYGYVYGWADWIKENAKHAAELGGYPAPAWASGWPTDAHFNQPVGAACADTAGSSDCGDGQYGTCITDDKQSPVQTYCTRQCNDLAPCPEGWSCDNVHHQPSLCVKDPPPPPMVNSLAGTGGCSVARPGSSSPLAAAGWALLVLVGAVRGLRRRNTH